MYFNKKGIKDNTGTILINLVDIMIISKIWPSQKTTEYMSPFTGDAQKRQIHKTENRPMIACGWGGGWCEGQGVATKWIFGSGDENVLNLDSGMVAQLSEYSKNQYTVLF